jgi:hypothetical protein
MRRNVGMSCTAITCVCAGTGAALATAACFSASSGGNQPLPSFDASMDTSFSEEAGPDTSMPPPEAAAEAAADVTVPPTEAGMDAGLDAHEAGCAPPSIAGFMVPPYVHANPQTIACNGLGNSDLEDHWFAQQCFGDAATYQSCQSFASSSPGDAGPEAGPVITDPGCAACLVTPQLTDAGYGPGIQGPVVVPNLAGCIELADPSDGGLSCAMAVQAAAACVEYACQSACPTVMDNATAALFVACTQTAGATVCSSYTQAATACIADEIGDGGASSNLNVLDNCFSSSDPAVQYAQLAAFFCST